MRSLVFGIFLLASSVFCGRNDYIEDLKSGRGYKLMYDAENWQNAKNTCANEGGKLAVPKSQHEFSVIQGLVRGMKYRSVRGSTSSVLLPWLGISNEEDHTVWRNVDGEDIEKTGYSTWAGGNGDKNSGPKEPHCAALDAVNPGLRSFWCHHKQPYVCEFKINC